MSEPAPLGRRTRQLRNVAEPIAASVFFAPEAHTAYARLGFANQSEGVIDGIALFDWNVYFLSRAACMGHINGEVAAAAFGVFPRDRVANAITQGWALTDPASILAAREHGAVTALGRLLGGIPDGVDRAVTLLQRGLDAAHSAAKPVFAGLHSLGWPGTPLGDLWRSCDLYREHRGDSHVVAWASVGLNGCEACILNDLRQGLDLGSYVRTRGWTRAQVDAAIAALRERDWIEGDTLSAAGREAREAIEAATDAQQLSIIQAIGEDFDELIALLTPWRNAIVVGRGYPGRAYLEQAGERARQS